MTLHGQKDVLVTTSTGDVVIKGKNVTVEANSGLDLKGASVKSREAGWPK